MGRNPINMTELAPRIYVSRHPTPCIRPHAYSAPLITAFINATSRITSTVFNIANQSCSKESLSETLLGPSPAKLLPNYRQHQAMRSNPANSSKAQLTISFGHHMVLASPFHLKPVLRLNMNGALHPQIQQWLHTTCPNTRRYAPGWVSFHERLYAATATVSNDMVLLAHSRWRFFSLGDIFKP
jgi:hypothetical protein